MPKLIEIFRIGKHTDSAGNEKEWNHADLDNLAEKYNSQKEYRAPLVIGHPQTDSPSYGWVEFLDRVGDRLFASVAAVSEKVTQAVQSGMFRNVSIALYADNLLRHVGLLGAAPPAVKGLAPVEFGENREWTEWEMAEKKTTEGKDMPEKEAKAGGETAPDKTETILQKNAVLAQENEKLKKELADMKKKAGEKEFNARLEKLISEGKVLPGEKEYLEEEYRMLAGAQSGTEFSEGEKPWTERLAARLDGRPVLIEPQGKQFASADRAADMSPADNTDRLAREFMEKHPGISYESAVRTVLYGGE